ncbi:MAG TPA: hypothetical protein VLD85_11275 [Anaeromyxobacteraceae bacterium]|nr:hypothetical protein [Anaeromyxobacteraceae bacterium]
MTGALFALLGAAAGGGQALLLRGAARGDRRAGVALRLSLVAGVLLAAALLGHLPGGAAGWATGFGLGGVLIARRLV